MLPLKVLKCVEPPDHLRSEISRLLQHSKTLENHENKNLLEINV